jgi:hypothetical protein
MKPLILIFSALLLSIQVFTQVDETRSEQNGKEKSRKQIRQERLEADYQRTKAVVDSMQFVLEADWLGSQWGEKIPVVSSLNFIMLDSVEAVIQTGNNFAVGRNGVGGTTATGKVTKMVINKNDKKKTLSVRLDVATTIGYFNIFMDITSSGYATATLSGMSAGKLIYYGKIIPLEDSFSYKGRSY